jgi:hypothetical protein
MDIRPEHFERFEAYWSGEMPDSDRQQLEIDLLVDPVLQQGFAEYKRIREGLDQLARKEVHKQLKSLDHSLDAASQNRPKNQHYKTRVLFLISSVAACLALGWFFYPTGYSVRWLPHEEGIPLLMGDQENRVFDSAMSAFRSVDFAEAAKAFSGLPDMEQNDTVLFYLANAELRSGNSALALRHFTILSTNKESVFYNKARYYMAMALWSAGNNKDAFDLLHQIAKESDHPYRMEAQAALEKLE